MSKYIIVYDDHCGVCNFGVSLMTRTGFVAHESSVQLSQFKNNSITCNIDPQKACDEMAVVNKNTKEVQYGTKGYSLLLAEKYPSFSRLFLSTPLIKIVSPFYLFFASNRRILAPLNLNETLCQPTLKKGYRLSLLIFLGFFATVITYIKGEILSTSEMFSFLNGYKLVQITGVGWILTGIMYNGPKRWDYWGHLAVMAGTAILIQSFALVGYCFIPHLYWIFSSMLITDLLMLYIHYKRIQIMQLSQKHTSKWWLILHITATLSLAQYYLN